MKKFLGIVGIIVILLAACLLIPWEHINWGKIQVLPASTITVTGEAKKDELPQIANFSASVTVINQDKSATVDEVNASIGKIIQAIKNFGINEADIQTQNISVNKIDDQPEIMIYPPRPAKASGWQATNSINITLRNISKASELADLLQASGATNVYGPNFSLDDTTQAQTDLLEKAIDDAREKANKIAVASKRKLGKVITVSESGPTPIYRGLDMAVSGKSVPTPVEPGTETVYKSVTVTFELK